MKKGQRYDVSGLVEAQFEPGSRGRVLKNLLGIKSKREMDREETLALGRATDALIRTYGRNHKFTAQDICHFHKIWLEGIYEWAGKYRQVNITKGEFTFSVAAQIPRLMQIFERDQLARYTPCRFQRDEEKLKAVAETHVELMLIHPFREGNGRVGRILSTLMALQAEFPLLDFSTIRGQRKQAYFVAVRAGLARNYAPMEKIFTEVIEKSFSGS